MEPVPSGGMFGGIVTPPVDMSHRMRLFEAVKADIKDEIRRPARSNVLEYADIAYNVVRMNG